jgi:hypothetical protein
VVLIFRVVALGSSSSCRGRSDRFAATVVVVGRVAVRGRV